MTEVSSNILHALRFVINGQPAVLLAVSLWSRTSPSDCGVPPARHIPSHMGERIRKSFVDIATGWRRGHALPLLGFSRLLAIRLQLRGVLLPLVFHANQGRSKTRDFEGVGDRQRKGCPLNRILSSCSGRNGRTGGRNVIRIVLFAAAKVRNVFMRKNLQDTVEIKGRARVDLRIVRSRWCWKRQRHKPGSGRGVRRRIWRARHFGSSVNAVLCLSDVGGGHERCPF